MSFSPAFAIAIAIAIVVRTGFVDNAEKINSRAAMIGFFGVIIVEAVRARKGAVSPVCCAMSSSFSVPLLTPFVRVRARCSWRARGCLSCWAWRPATASTSAFKRPCAGGL
jgi:hypothetical protein